MPSKIKREMQLSVLHPDAAGVDIGAGGIFIAVAADRDANPVRRFATFTPDLEAAADWLSGCGIRTVAMESTSVYWIPFYHGKRHTNWHALFFTCSRQGNHMTSQSSSDVRRKHSDAWKPDYANKPLNLVSN